MASRDKYGNYVNDKGVTIKIGTSKSGNDHVSFYGGDVDKPHDAAHVNVNYDNGSWSSTTHNSAKSDTNSSSGSCYLTTACMKHMIANFDDNCYELTMLRWFRDRFVSREDIDHYYETAPIIVDAINQMVDNEVIYNDIYNNVVSVCVQAINEGSYDLAYDVYRNSILELEEQFARPALNNRLVKGFEEKNGYLAHFFLLDKILISSFGI